MEGWIKGVRVLERVLDAGWWVVGGVDGIPSIKSDLDI